MHTENLKKENQDLFDANDPFVKTDRVYKPTHTVEFNRVGEVLLFSSSPMKHMTLYFKYPYILYESLIPAAFFMWFVNPFALAWTWNYLNLVLIGTAWWPRVWWWRSVRYRPRRMWLLRGGRYVKIESTSMAGDRFTVWAESREFNVLTKDGMHFEEPDQAEFLNEGGQLKYETTIQASNYKEQGVNSNDVLVHFMEEGVVHEPELFEAVLKGYNVDTTDYVINTGHNLRSRDGIHNV